MGLSWKLGMEIPCLPLSLKAMASTQSYLLKKIQKLKLFTLLWIHILNPGLCTDSVLLNIRYLHTIFFCPSRIRWHCQFLLRRQATFWARSFWRNIFNFIFPQIVSSLYYFPTSNSFLGQKTLPKSFPLLIFSSLN